VVERRTLLYDKAGEEHFNLIRRLHKSLRNSDPDAAVYWLAGCSRRARTCSTGRAAHPLRLGDIATPIRSALTVAVAAKDAAHFSGCRNQHGAGAVRRRTWPRPQEQRRVRGLRTAAAMPPGNLPSRCRCNLRNAPTRLMKTSSTAKGYQYAPHDAPTRWPTWTASRRRCKAAATTRPTDPRVREGDQAPARRLGGRSSAGGARDSDGPPHRLTAPCPTSRRSPERDRETEPQAVVRPLGARCGPLGTGRSSALQIRWKSSRFSPA